MKGLTGFTLGDATDALGITNNENTRKANKANLAESALNRQFQERMSNTAYSRAMTDMKSAGLNPTLAYMQGGASQPQGATATVQAAPQSQLGSLAMQAGLGIATRQQQATALQQQQQMNDSSITLQASSAAKNLADVEKIKTETKGMGKKEAEGELWEKAYKKLNAIFDASAKDAKQRNKNSKPLIKPAGGDKKSDSKMFQWLNKGNGLHD